MKLIIAKYRGRCTACHQSFAPGDSIAYAGRGQTMHESCADVERKPARRDSSFAFGVSVQESAHEHNQMHLLSEAETA